MPDGFRLDTEGNIWTSSQDGVQCYSPEGRILGKILTPERVSNLTFGGLKRNRIFMTATTSIYTIYYNTRDSYESGNGQEASLKRNDWVDPPSKPLCTSREDTIMKTV